MQISKHLFVLLLIFSTVNTSCSKNDSNEGEDNIIGTWQRTKMIVVSIDGTSTEIEKEELCHNLDKEYFFEDGSYSSEQYTEEEGQCKESYITLTALNGSFEKFDDPAYPNSNYHLILYYSFGAVQNLPQVSFPKNNTMRYTYYYDEEAYEHTEEKLDSYYIEYKRIK